MNNSMLEFNNVSHVFPDGTKALNGLSASINKGEFCVLLGSSGAGKSTLLGMANGMVSPTTGKVVFEGEHISRKNIRKIQRHVGMIHQQLHLSPRLSTLHNVLAGILPDATTWRSMFKLFPREDQRRACNLMEEVELEEKHLYRRATHLSGGQQQRVAIARAFMMNPRVVLADEPVASLDPNISRQVLYLLKKASRHHGATVLCSLHQVGFAIEFADRIIGLCKGEIVFDGSPADLNKTVLDAIYKNGSSVAPMVEIDFSYSHDPIPQTA